MVQLKAGLLATQEEDFSEGVQEKKRQRLAEKKAKEETAMDQEVQVLMTMQQGAHERTGGGVCPPACGPPAIQGLFGPKRKHEESGLTVSCDALMSAQTSQTKAIEVNRALDEEFRAKRRP